MKNFFMTVVIFLTGAAAALILTHGSARAQESVNNGEMLEKLNEISRSQQAMFMAINSIKEDVQLIKIRVTQSQ
jgi:hypothetical protein